MRARLAHQRGGRGFVYATTGEKYTVLARRSARSLRALHPDIPIDLFTDQPVTDPVFDRVHALERVPPLAKIEALRRSRFRDSIYLDADTVAITRLDELFEMAGRFDLSASMGLSRPGHMQTWQRDIPRWFPVLNAGLLVYRQGRRTRRLSRLWQRAMERHEIGKDQPHLRRLAWDLGLRIGIVPLEYNLIQVSHLSIWETLMGAPRMLHVRALHDGPPGNPDEPIDWRALVTPAQAARIDALLEGEARRNACPQPTHPMRRHRLGLGLIRAWKRYGPLT